MWAGLSLVVGMMKIQVLFATQVEKYWWRTGLGLEHSNRTGNVD